jgi:hypothetical protein
MPGGEVLDHQTQRSDRLEADGLPRCWFRYGLTEEVSPRGRQAANTAVGKRHPQMDLAIDSLPAVYEQRRSVQAVMRPDNAHPFRKLRQCTCRVARERSPVATRRHLGATFREPVRRLTVLCNDLACHLERHAAQT